MEIAKKKCVRTRVCVCVEGNNLDDIKQKQGILTDP